MWMNEQLTLYELLKRIKKNIYYTRKGHKERVDEWVLGSGGEKQPKASKKCHESCKLECRCFKNEYVNMSSCVHNLSEQSGKKMKQD